MNARRTTRSRSARWGLLVTTVVTGVVLVAVSGAGYLDVRRTAGAVVRERSMDLVMAARRSLLAAGAVDGDTLQAVVDEMKPQGLRYLAVVDPPDGVRAAGGKASAPVEGLGCPRRGQGPRIAVDWDRERVRVTSPLAPGPGGRHHRRGRRWGPGPWTRGGGSCPVLLVEFTPSAAGSMVARAAWNLGLSLAAAGLLLVLSLVFFRLSRRAERFQRQLEEERRLAALGEMSAVLGHELRNPIASLKGHAQLLVEKLPADHPGRAKAETVVTEAVRLERLTGQVLAFVRSGRPEQRKTQLAELIDAVLQRTGDHRVEVHREEMPARWSLDPERIQQVLVNLIENALAASGEGQVVELSAAEEEGMLVLRVEDRGSGIEPGEEERVFEPFYTRRVQGTGLGLAVARRIAEGHGGTLQADNREGGGARFTVRLPRGVSGQRGTGA